MENNPVALLKAVQVIAKTANRLAYDLENNGWMVRNKELKTAVLEIMTQLDTVIKAYE